MKVNLGRGFGPLDFDENGRLYSLFPENLPYVDDDFDGDSDEFTVYVDADLVETVCNAGLDFDEFLQEDEEGRADMLKAAGIDPENFDLDFDRDVRERLEEAGYFDEDYDDEYDDEYDEDFDEDEEYDEDEDDEDFDEDEDFEDDDDFDDEDDDGDEDDDSSDDGPHYDPPPEDEFFGNL